jgi:hypothetical protein
VTAQSNDLSSPNRTRTPAWCAAAVFALAFVWMLMSGMFLDDHFDRISRGWQIWVYGESPFIDFRDPGYYLTLYASAAVQALSGGSLLGEAVLNSAAIALAVALTFLFVVEASRSPAVGLLAAALALGVPPRYYDYDKVLFYALGLACCWRYVDRRPIGLVVTAGLLTTVAGLFRYDNGLFLAVAFLATLIACHARDWRTLIGRSAIYGLAALLAVMPFLIGWHRTIGLPEVWRQVSAYAAREGRRSQLFQVPTILREADPFLAWIYGLSILLIPIVLWSLTRADRPKDEALAQPVPKMLATLVVSGLVAVFVLRDPIDARIGAAIPTATVLGGYLVGRWGPRRIAAALPLRSVALGLVVLAVIVVGVRAARTLEAPSATRIGRRVIERVIGRIQARTAAPADLAALPDRRRYEGMVGYLRACTPPDSRVLTTWFAPHVHYFAQRGFAGGMPVTFGGHWNSAADQARTIEQLRSQTVPLVLVESESLTGFNAEYGRVADYLEQNYRLAGTSSFGAPEAGPEAYRVMIRSSVTPAYTESRWNLPCLVPRR